MAVTHMKGICLENFVLKSHQIIFQNGGPGPKTVIFDAIAGLKVMQKLSRSFRFRRETFMSEPHTQNLEFLSLQLSEI